MSYSSFFFFKLKTAYELRISDWSSDVCSSGLHRIEPCAGRVQQGRRDVDDIDELPPDRPRVAHVARPVKDHRGAGAARIGPQLVAPQRRVADPRPGAGI